MGLLCRDIANFRYFNDMKVLAAEDCMDREIFWYQILTPDSVDETEISFRRGDCVILSADIREWNDRQMLRILDEGIRKKAACIILFGDIEKDRVSDLWIDTAAEGSIPLLFVRERDLPIRMQVQEILRNIARDSGQENAEREIFRYITENSEKAPAEIRLLERVSEYDFDAGHYTVHIACHPKKHATVLIPEKKEIVRICRKQMESREETFLDGFFQDCYIILIPEKDEEKMIRALAEGMMSALAESGLLRQIDFFCGIGNPRSGIEGQRESAGESAQLVRAMRIFSEPGSIRTVPEYMHLILLLNIRDHKQLYRLRNPKIRNLYSVGSSEVNQNELSRTLETYLQYGRNAKRTAEALFIHRNTLSMRLKKIEKLCDIDLSDPECAFELQFAIFVEKCLIYG